VRRSFWGDQAGERLVAKYYKQRAGGQPKLQPETMRVGKQQLKPESMMMSYGYDPSLSEGAIKCPIFQTSTFVFENAEAGKAFFEVAMGMREQGPTEELGLIYSRLNNPDLEILEDRLCLWDGAEAGAAFEHEIQVGREYSVQGFRFTSNTLESVPHRFPLSQESEVVDGGLLGKHLILRSWRDGDSFVPLGMKESKKLSDFFVNQKVSLHQKHQTPILESDGTIVWVCGLRLDNRFRVTPTTRSAVRLCYSPISQ